jgi:hypothetical protein
MRAQARRELSLAGVRPYEKVGMKKGRRSTGGEKWRPEPSDWEDEGEAVEVERDISLPPKDEKA